MCVNLKIYNNRIVPCGKCPQCKKKMRNEWFVRMSCEKIQQKYTPFFCTFTYNDDNLPDNALFRYSDFQNFIKKVRVYIQRKKYSYKLRYIVVGEFGDKRKTERPHYHAIIYGVPYNKEFVDLFRKYWTKGFSDYKPARSGAFNYITKYCVKSLSRFKESINSETGEVVRDYEFKRSSHSLGRSWLDNDEIKNRFLSDFEILKYDMKIKLGKFSYSLPYSWKQYFKKKNNVEESDLVHVLYVRDLEMVNEANISKIKTMIYNNWPQIDYFSIKEIKPFSDLLTEYSANIVRDKAFLKKEKKDYWKFYKDIGQDVPDNRKNSNNLYSHSFVFI